jgi:magnesium transporter
VGGHRLRPTLVAGIYGMNFQHMPELAWPWGYPSRGLMVAVSAGLYLVFKKKDWI